MSNRVLGFLIFVTGVVSIAVTQMIPGEQLFVSFLAGIMTALGLFNMVMGDKI